MFEILIKPFRSRTPSINEDPFTSRVVNVPPTLEKDPDVPITVPVSGICTHLYAPRGLVWITLGAGNAVVHPTSNPSAIMQSVVSVFIEILWGCEISMLASS